MDTTNELKNKEALASLGVDEKTLTAAQRHELDEVGYIIIPDVVGADERNRLRRAFDRACDLESIPPRGTRHPTKLLECDAGFLRFPTHPVLLAAVLHVLCRPFFVAIGGRDPLPGFGQQGLHADWVEPVASTQYHVVTAFGLLDAFSADNGATRLVPGSHRERRPPHKSFLDPASRHPQQVVVTAPAGSVLVFNGHLWHGGTCNRSGDHRRTVQCSFQRREHLRSGTTGPPNPDLGPAVRFLLGFDPA
jgi:ectoine hydroxylase-related dioxygenase (phytanoyl-CoA dioxygenase family)